MFIIFIIAALIIIPQAVVIWRYSFIGWILSYVLFGTILWYFLPSTDFNKGFLDLFAGWLLSGYIVSCLAAVGAIFAPLGPIGGTAAAGIIGFILGGWMAGK